MADRLGADYPRQPVMTKQVSNSPDKTGSKHSKPWFLPALVGIALVGIVLIILVPSLNGPAKPLIDPAVSAQNNIRFNQAMALLEQGRKLVEAEKYKEAMPLAEQALALCPDVAPTHRAVAQIALQMRDYNRAEQEFRAVLARDPGDEMTLFNLAAIAAIRKDYLSARKQVADALTKVDPQRAGQSLPLTVLQAAANMDQPQVAAKYMHDAIQRDASHGAILVEAKVYGPDVIALLAEQLEQPDSTTAGSPRATSDAAGACYALAAKDTTGNLLKAQRAARAAEHYLSAGKPDAALGQVRVCLEADPANPLWIVLRDRIAAASSQPAAASQPSINMPSFGL